MATPETSSDVLRHIVMAMQTDSDVHQSLANEDLGEDRLLAAIAADDAERERANGYWWAEHCHDDFCEDCFGS